MSLDADVGEKTFPLCIQQQCESELIQIPGVFLLWSIDDITVGGNTHPDILSGLVSHVVCINRGQRTKRIRDFDLGRP